MSKRPCECGEAGVGPYARGQCRLCWLAMNDAKYRRLWGVTAAPAGLTAGPCPHLGAPTGEVATCAGCGGARLSLPVFACALHGTCTTDRKAGGVYCCKSCEDRPRPKAEEKRDPWADRVSIPPAPPIDLQPRRKTAVVTVAFGKSEAEFAASGPLMERFAGRVGADFRVLTWPGHAAYPFSGKFAVARAAEQYDRILYADADVLFRAGCVNPFDLCHPDEWGAFDEAAYHQCRPEFGRRAEYERFLKDRGLSGVTSAVMFNAGVMVVPNAAAWVHESPTFSLPTYHCAEQDATTARVVAAAAAGRLKYRALDRRANWQWWTDDGFKLAPQDAVLHFSACPDRAARMRAFAAALSPPTPTTRE